MGNNIQEEIKVQVYYSETDEGKILIDEESIRDEFEEKLREIVVKANRKND